MTKTNEGFPLTRYIKLGTGILTWSGHERRSDRYGFVWLMQDGATSLTDGPNKYLLDQKMAAEMVGFKGRLSAYVLDPRESTHIGDLFRGIFHVVPKLHEDVVLGEGTLVTTEQEACGTVVGLKPDDGRTKDWLDPNKLYRAHEQLVELRFWPIDAKAKPQKKSESEKA